MVDIIYIHGFLSSPASFKAQATQAWLSVHRPELSFHCPALSSYPEQALNTLLSCVESCSSKPCLIGSSLGGFWASYLIEEGLADKAVLVNPAVSPHTRFQHYIGQSLKSYYSDDYYCLSVADLQRLADAEKPVIHVDRYWVLLQTGDEVLGYRMAEQRYHACEQLIEQGGDHSFTGYDRHLEAMMHFFGF